MARCKHGFISVVILLVLMLFSIVCISFWLTVVHFKSLTQKKQQYTKEFWLAQGALSCAISNISDFVLSSSKLEKEEQLLIDPWPPDKKSFYKAEISYMPKGSDIKTVVSLFDKKKLKRQLYCVVSKDKKSNLLITDWHEETKTK